MGFGLLLLGYFMTTLMALNRLGGVFRFAGFIFVLIASKKLSQYNRSFFSLMICSIAMLAVSALGAFDDVTGFLYEYALIPSQFVSQSVSNIFSAVEAFFDFAFTALL